MTVEYSKLNSIKLAQPPHHTRQRLNVLVLENAEGYPIPSMTNQRRRKLPGHRGCGEKQLPILKNRVDKETHQIEKVPVGIWRGVDPVLAKGYREAYNGAGLRAIRAKNGVGRPPKTVAA